MLFQTRRQEDRKRLKEKLKLALASENSANTAKVVRAREEWLDYIFGICKPDRRIGKQGSRCGRLRWDSAWSRMRAHADSDVGVGCQCRR